MTGKLEKAEKKHDALLFGEEEKLIETFDVVIPSRGCSSIAVSEALFRGLQANTPPITSFNIIHDDGRGQTRIRYEAALESMADYVLLLDDDIEMSKGMVTAFLSKIHEGYDAVCGEVVPVALNNFSKQVLQWKTNPSVFYPTGITLWRRERLLEVMKALPNGTTNLTGDVAMGQTIRDKGLKTCKIPVNAKHYADTSPLQFFKYRYSCGVSLGFYARRNREFTKLIIRFTVGILLSRSLGMLIYRSATLLGMIASLVEAILLDTGLVKNIFPRLKLRQKLFVAHIEKESS